MSHIYKRGDRVRVVTANVRHKIPSGVQGTVARGNTTAFRRSPTTGRKQYCTYCLVRVDGYPAGPGSIDGCWRIAVKFLRPLLPPAVEKTTWAEFKKATGCDPRTPVKVRSTKRSTTKEHT